MYPKLPKKVEGSRPDGSKLARGLAEVSPELLSDSADGLPNPTNALDSDFRIASKLDKPLEVEFLSRFFQTFIHLCADEKQRSLKEKEAWIGPIA